MNRFLLFLVLVVMFCGCASSFKKNLFADIRNDHIGSHKENIISPQILVEVIPHNATQDKYICAYDDGCKWAYFVNKKTGIIESWEYISSPDKCQTGLNWFGPW